LKERDPDAAAHGVSRGIPSVSVVIPEVGDRREFKVLNRNNKFDQVTARVRHVSDHLILYVDEKSPTGGFLEEDLEALSRQFEDPIYPVVTGVFGAESDLDQNERIIILMTPAVNRLTELDSDGYIGGFFFGLDLLIGESGSNEGEIFYAIVPDPTGSEGPALSKASVLATVPAVLAHEFEHMVHFNQRILRAGAQGQEALWLSEAMAQMAEELVGEAFEAAGDLVKAHRYQVGNWTRARRFLADPSEISLIATLPPGSLSERGAWWLFLRYLYGRAGEEELLSRLAHTTLSGVANVTEVMRREWSGLVSDWTGALYFDGLSIPVRPELRVWGINLRQVLASSDGRYPLSPPVVGPTSFIVSGALWSSAPDYYIIVPPATGGMALNLAGPEGRPQDPSAGLRLLVVRLN
jgi:hypothetical protein